MVCAFCLLFGFLLYAWQKDFKGRAFAWFAIGMLLFYKWRCKPALLRNSLWISVPLIVLTLFFGRLTELRASYEAYPIAILLTAHSIAFVQGISVVARDGEKNCGHPEKT